MVERLDKDEKSKVLSFFLLGFPTVLIIALGMLAPSVWWASILIAIYQFIMLKQFLDKHYGDL